MELCGMCGTSTNRDTKLGGLIMCESCLIAEVQTYLELTADGTIAAALSLSPIASEDMTVPYWAERTVKDDAFNRCRSLGSKRGGSGFYYADTYAAKRCGLSVDEFRQARAEYLERNPMTYAATTGRMTYKAAANA